MDDTSSYKQLKEENEQLKKRVAALKKNEQREREIGDITNRKKAEEALKKEIEARGILLANIPTQIWYLTDERTYGAVNKAHADFNGVSDEALSFKDVHDIYPKDVAETCIKGNREVFSTGKTIKTEEWVPNASGEKRLLLIVKTPKLDKEGIVEYVVCSAEDITESKRMEKALEESEAKYRSLIENSNDAIYFLYNRKFEIINSKFEQMFGYTLEEVNKPDFDFIQLVAPKSRSMIEARLDRIRKGEKLENRYEFTALSKDGNELEVETSITYIPYKESIATQGVIRNISGRKRAEEALRESEQKYKKLFYETPLGTFHYNTEGIITECNEKFVDIIGSSKAALVGLNMIKKLNNNTLIEEVKSSLKKGEGYYEGDYTSVTGGKTTTVRVLFKGMRNKEGNIYAGVGLVEDITERKKIEEQLRRKNEELQTTERELIASNKELKNINHRLELQKKELEKAKKKAEESDRLKSTFLANMSHEIRSPMNGIMGFSQILQKQDLPKDEQKKYLDVIYARTNQLLNIINDIVDISKIEANQLQLDFQYVYLNDILQETYNIYLNELKSKGKGHITLNINKGLPYKNSYIHTAPNRLRQIIDNLLDNALKHTYKGAIEFGYEFESENTLLFYVQDSGHGIPHDQQNHIFERFRQSDGSSGEPNEGTGLGLTISKNLVELLGGKMWMTSIEGEGSVFYFTLPYKSKSNIESMETQKKEPNVDNSEDKTILIIEDEPSSREYLKKLFEPYEFTLILCKTGKEGYKALINNPGIDLILLDLKLPDIDGLDIVRKIRSSSTNREVPVIAQTAYAMSGDDKKSIEAGCDDYISKPIEIDQLLEKVNKFI